MKKIQMVDLQSQYQTIKSQVNESIQKILESSTYINGPEVHSFQENLQNYNNVKHVIPCANGTDALQVAMMALGLKPGDEVITADFTFAATVEVIGLLQLTPVLVDVYPNTYNIDLEALENAITPKTKAIVPVHLFGQAANMEGIMAIAEKHNLYVIEDNAQGIGANYYFSDGSKKKTGTIGHVSATSFFPSKNLGCYGDGGAIFTNDDQLAHIIRGIVNHGMYERYHHDVIGVNSRLDSIQAAVLNAKLPYLDQYNSRRRASAMLYNELLSSVEGLIVPTIEKQEDSHVFHQYVLRVKDNKRNGLLAHLQSKDIPCAIYYPIALHEQKAYLDPRYKQSDFPITNDLVQEVLALPMHSELEEDQIAFICQEIKNFLQ